MFSTVHVITGDSKMTNEMFKRKKWNIPVDSIREQYQQRRKERKREKNSEQNSGSAWLVSYVFNQSTRF